MISPIKILDPGRKCFYRRVCDYPLLTMSLVLSSHTQFIPNPQLSHLFFSLLLLYSNKKVMEASSVLYSGIITHQFKLWPNPQKHQTLHLYIYMWPRH